MRIYFNDDDDIVIEDIPDELMQEIERRASLKGCTPEEEVRSAIIAHANSSEAR